MSDRYRNQDATLGCGTLILIALIVLIFGNRANDDVMADLHDIEAEIRRLETTVESQNTELRELRKAVEALAVEPKEPADASPLLERPPGQ